MFLRGILTSELLNNMRVYLLCMFSLHLSVGVCVCVCKREMGREREREGMGQHVRG